NFYLENSVQDDLLLLGLFLVILVDLSSCEDSTARSINLAMAWRPVQAVQTLYSPVQAVQAVQAVQPVHKPQATQFISIPTLAKANTAQLLQIAHYNAQLLNARMKDLQTQYSNQQQQYSSNNQYRNPFAIFGVNASSPKYRAALLNDIPLKPFSPKYTVTTSGLSPISYGNKQPIYLSEIDHHLPLVHSSTPKIPVVVPSVGMSPSISHYSYIPLLSASPSSLIFRDTPVVMPAAQSATFQGKTTLKPHPVLNKLQAHLALATTHKQPYGSYSNIFEKLTVPVLAPNVFKNHVVAANFVKNTKNVQPVSKIINNTAPKRIKQTNVQPSPTPSATPDQKTGETGIRTGNQNKTQASIFEAGPFTPIVRENAVVKDAKPTLKSSDVLNELNRHRNIIQIMEGLPQIPSSVSSVDISGEQNFRPIDILKKYNISKSPLQDLTRFSFQPNSYMDFTSPSRKYPLLPTIPTTMVTSGDRLSPTHFRLNEIKETTGTAFTPMMPFLPTPNSYGLHKKPLFSGSHTFFTIEDAVTGTTPTRNTIDYKSLFDTTTELIKPVREDTNDVTTTAPEPHTHFYKFMKYPSSSSTVTIFETTTPKSKLKHRRRKPGNRFKSNISDSSWIDKLPKESIRVEKNVTTEASEITSTTRHSARFRQRPKTETTTTTTKTPEITTDPTTEVTDQVAPTTVKTTSEEAINITTTTVSTTSVAVQTNSSTLKPMAKYNSISRPRLSLKNSSYYLSNLSTSTTTNQPSEIVTTPKFTRKRLPTRPSTTTTEASEEKTSSTESSTTTTTTTSTSKRFHPTRNNNFTRPSFTKPSTEGPVSRGSTGFPTRRGSSRVDFRNQKSTTSTSTTTDSESSTRSSTTSHRRFQSAQDKLASAKQRHRVEETIL
uniref:Uncharacterized protein n=1 Tax=Phlebotomus papatasi TaxID=29031 RepID=A0A1B0GLX5_PHLPP